MKIKNVMIKKILLLYLIFCLFSINTVEASTNIYSDYSVGGVSNQNVYSGIGTAISSTVTLCVKATVDYTFDNFYFKYNTANVYYRNSLNQNVQVLANGSSASGVVRRLIDNVTVGSWTFTGYGNDTSPAYRYILLSSSFFLQSNIEYQFQYENGNKFMVGRYDTGKYYGASYVSFPTDNYKVLFNESPALPLRVSGNDVGSFVSWRSPIVTGKAIYKTNISGIDIFQFTLTRNYNADMMVTVKNTDTNYQEHQFRDQSNNNITVTNATIANRKILVDYYENAILKTTLTYYSTIYSAIGGTYKLSGYVIDTKDGSYIPFAYVQVNKSGNVKYDIANEEGYYEILNLANDNYVLNASITGFNTFSTNITINNKNLDYIVYLTPFPNQTEGYNNSIFGYVKSKDGLPLENAIVTFSNKSYLTNENGYFLLFNFTVGNNTLKVEKTDYLSYTETINMSANTSYYRVITLLKKIDTIIKPEKITDWQEPVIGIISGESGKMPTEEQTFKFLFAIAILLMIFGIIGIGTMKDRKKR